MQWLYELGFKILVAYGETLTVAVGAVAIVLLLISMLSKNARFSTRLFSLVGITSLVVIYSVILGVLK